MPERKASTSRIKDFMKSGSIRRKPGSKDGKDKKQNSVRGLPPFIATRLMVFVQDGRDDPLEGDSILSPNGEFKAELDGGSDAELPASSPRGDSATTSESVSYDSPHGVDYFPRLIAKITTNLELIRGLHQLSLGNFDASPNDNINHELHHYGTKTRSLCHQLTEHFTNPALMAKMAAGSTEIAKACIRAYQNLLSDYLDSVRLQMEDKYRLVRPEATDQEVANALRDLPSRNFSVSILRIDEREEIQPIIRAVERRSRTVSVAEESLRELQHLQDAISVTEANLTQLYGMRTGPDRTLHAEDCVISPVGDVVMVFGANPQVQFQVSSQALSSVSPLFSYALHPYTANDRFQRGPPPPDLVDELPKTAPTVVSSSLPPIVRMPQEEMNEMGALSTLLYAAHARHDKVPRTIEFQEFVAIAAVCHKYRCTAPVEIFVECFWLPQWKDQVGQKGFEDFLFISYVFGLERIFELTSKAYILSGPFEEHRLPEHVCRRLNQARAFHLAKVVERCNWALSSYLPLSIPLAERNAVKRRSTASHTEENVNGSRISWQLISPTRCPHGSHACDAANLGWLMMVLNEVGVPHAYSNQSRGSWVSWQGLTLKQVFAKLCAAPSADDVHEGGCNYATAFRNDMCDLFNGIRALNVREVNEMFAGRRPSAIRRVGGPAADENVDGRRRSAGGSAGSTPRRSIVYDGGLPSSGDLGAAFRSFPTYQEYMRRTLPSPEVESEFVSSSPWPDNGNDAVQESQESGKINGDPDRRSIASTEVDTRTERGVSPSPTMASVVTPPSQATTISVITPPSEATMTGVIGPPSQATMTGVITPPSQVTLNNVATTNAANTEANTSDALLESREADKIFWKQHAHKERITIADKELIISRKHIMRIGEERGIPPFRPDGPEQPQSPSSVSTPRVVERSEDSSPLQYASEGTEPAAEEESSASSDAWVSAVG